MTIPLRTIIRSRVGLFALALAGSALVGLGCAQSSVTAAAGQAPAAPTARPAAPAITPALRSVVSMDAPIAAVLDQLGDDVKEFHAHVTTLSNPFFEGRAPGSHGIEVAADYIEFTLKGLGLEPPFQQTIEAADGSHVTEASYRQPFDVAGETIVDEALLEWSAAGAHGEPMAKTDFDPTPFSANGRATGPVVFVGYAIESGPDGYTSFKDDADLTGKIALVLRFEPMDEKGKSLWSKRGRWTNNAGLIAKIRSVVDRGAVGVILVNPPGADDPRAGRLLSARGSRFGGTGDAPVVMMTTDAAEKMIAGAEPGGRSLMDLRRLADAGSTGAVELPGLTASTSVQMSRKQIPTANIAAVLPGKGALRNEYIVIGAHYDHLGYGAYGTRHPGALHPGADDNASGTSGVLLAAHILRDVYAQAPDDEDARSILFITFSAEEMGLLGSKHFVEDPPFALSQIDAMLNMDMIGRLRDSQLEILVPSAGDPFGAELEADAGPAGLRLKRNTELGGRSDHASFADAGVPAIAFFSGMHPDYHAPGDVGSKIHHKGAVRIVEFVSKVALDLATRPERVRFVAEKKVDRPSPPRMANMTVRLGIAPANYADEKPGVLVGAVAEGTSAADAGMKKGDRIIRWDGEELLDVVDMMKHLAASKPGDVARLIVLRDNKDVELTVTLKARGGAS